MAITDDDEKAVVEALSRDLKAWRLDRYLHLITAEASNARDLVEDRQDFIEKVVEDVQQDLMDQFIDTTWPRCPRHFRHPLWYHDGAWFCDQDNAVIAKLGELPSPPPGESPWRLVPAS